MEDQDSDEEEEEDDDDESVSQDSSDTAATLSGIEKMHLEGPNSTSVTSNSLSFGSASTSAFKLFNKVTPERIKNEGREF